MSIFVKIVGLIMAIMGIVLILTPKTLNQLVNFCQKGKRLRIGAIIRIIIGVIFLNSASQCKLPLVVAIIGVLILIKGIMVFVLGPQRVRSTLEWWNKRPAQMIRLLGLIALALGLLLIYSV